MAKKAAGEKKAEAIATPTRKRTGIAVRLDLSPKDHERLSKLAKRRGLTMASYARMVILERMDAEEGGK
jgi:hypothetical protein